MNLHTIAKFALMGLLFLTTIGHTHTETYATDRKQMLWVSSEQLHHLANHAYAQTIAQAKRQGVLDMDITQVMRLKRIANALIPHTVAYRKDAMRWQWGVHLIEDGTVNAYVMPNGKIIFYSGIIKRLRLTDAEIAAIMGHEMAHVLREHSREKLSHTVATTGVIGIASGALGLSSGQAQMAGLAGSVGLDLPHSRTQEAEADKIGLELMARAGYNPNAAISLWQKMQADDNEVPQFLSTHPSHASRIKSVQELLPTVMPLYENAKAEKKP